MKEDGRAILRTPVRPLTVELRGVMVLPEDLQQVFVMDFRWIVVDFTRFGVAGAVGTDILIRWAIQLASGVANACGLSSRNLAEGGFDSPKASRRKCSFL